MKFSRDLPLVVSVLLTSSLVPHVFAQSIPVQTAEQSHVKHLPAIIEPDVKGFGTRGVEGQTLDEMLDRCKSTATSATAVEKARCQQLKRTLKNQPGGTFR